MQPRQHHMPFGAQLTAAGEVRFRLWAPAARQVDVILYDGGGTPPLAMRSLPGGWVELETGAARPGRRYRFRLDGGRDVADPASRLNPQGSYGTPQELNALIAAAHRHGLAMLLDVVYNHFGPEGNSLHWYAPQFFTERHVTPWGPAVNFDGPDSATVREFFIHNALYWLEEYHFDGLRLDAIHAVHDESEPHIVNQIARAARAAEGRNRPIYLTLENLDNAVRFLGAAGAAATCDAQWNDDAHHCLHVLLSGESGGYYADYARQPQALLCRSLAQGFAYQGEPSRYLGRPRGASSAHLPPSAFVNFLQNHDQIGNRARGERLAALVPDEAALRAAAAVLLLSPAPPLLFMGEEWAATEPFPWFCDLEPQLAARVWAHRSREFPGSADPAAAPLVGSAAGRVIFATQDAGATLPRQLLAPWSVLWLLESGRESR